MKSLSPMLLLAIAVPLSAIAAEGAFEINQDCAAVGCFAGDTAGFPITITSPGKYLLTSDLATSGANDAIDVSATDVEIDLNGHTISGGGACSGNGPLGVTCVGLDSGAGLSVTATGALRVHIHDGTVHGFTTGIAILNADYGTVVDHLTVTQNHDGMQIQAATSASAVTRILNSQLDLNANDGALAVNSTLLHVENSTFADNGNNGLLVASGSAVVGNRFTNNGSPAVSGGAVGLGQNTFWGNNGGSGSQFSVSTYGDMGGNTCLNHPSGSCP